jgi:hypothetical protein
MISEPGRGFACLGLRVRPNPSRPQAWRYDGEGSASGRVRRPRQAVFKEIPKPEPAPGTVVIKVKAFGVNHAEMHIRRDLPVPQPR